MAEAGRRDLEDTAHALRTEVADARLRAAQADERAATASRLAAAREDEREAVQGKNETLQVWFGRRARFGGVSPNPRLTPTVRV